jgi:dipeptidase E
MTKKLLIVGGGEMGRILSTEKGPVRAPIETLEIDKRIVELSEKAHPKLLFIPTASNDSKGYTKVMQEHFGERLGCRVEPLYLITESLSREEIRKRILASDIIYVGGGSTLKLITKWRELGVDKILREAYEQGIVLSGISAGGICWFKYGQSDSLKTAEEPQKLILVEGIGLIPAIHAPHLTREPYRHESLQSLTKELPEVAIGLEDCAALEIIGDKYRIITSKPEAKAYKCYWKEGKYHKEQIPQLKEFSDLEGLLRK